MQHALSTPDRICPLGMYYYAQFMCTVNPWSAYYVLYVRNLCEWSCPLWFHCTCVMFFSDYRPALSLVSNTGDFSKCLFTFTYSYQESCSLYLRCTPYFSVEHTVSPQSAVNISSSGCSVEYTIHNLMRCVSYQSTATILIGNQRGNPVVVEGTVMQSEWLQLICGWTS